MASVDLAAAAARAAGADQLGRSVPAHRRLDFARYSGAPPIVLYGSRALLIDERVTARAGLATLAVTLAILIASPIIACVRLTNGPDPYRPHFQQVAEIGASLTGRPVELIWGRKVSRRACRSICPRRIR